MVAAAYPVLILYSGKHSSYRAAQIRQLCGTVLRLIVICSFIGIAPVQFTRQIPAGTASITETLSIAGGTGAGLTGFTVIA